MDELTAYVGGDDGDDDLKDSREVCTLSSLFIEEIRHLVG